MTKSIKTRLEILISGIATIISAGVVLHLMGWSAVLLVYYMLSLALAVTAFRSVFHIPDADEQMTPRHSVLSVALGMGAGLAVTIGMQIILWPLSF